MITFSDVSKKYNQKEHYALKQLTLEIHDGELVVFIGPSGSGKSTLLELICGFESLTEGDIKIDGYSVINKLPSEREIGMVFQNYALLPHMNVYDNIAFGMKVRKEEKKKIAQKVQWAAQILQIEDFLKVKPKELSGGQRQRVALARAMVREPKIFLMDEPLSNLDVKLREHMCKEIKQLQKQLGTTMIYVTHDQTEAMMLADKIAILKDGVLQQYGTPYEVYNNPANIFVAQFIGRPGINLLECVKLENSLLIEDNYKIEGEFNQLKEGIRYKLGIRSEDLMLTEEEDWHIEAKVRTTHYLGSEHLIDLAVGKSIVLVKQYKNKQYKENDNVKLKIDLEKAHYFELQIDNKEMA